MLLVDDEPQLLELAKLFLEKASDIRVTTVQCADDAHDILGDGSFEAVVADYQMPGTDGLEFLKSLRAEGNNIPFVLFTGKGREDVAIEALNSGADFYLQKGGDPNSQFAELANMIRTAVAAREAQQDLAESEERFRLLAENSMDMVYRYEFVPTPRFGYVSPASTRIVGYTPEEHYANPNLGMEIVHPDDVHIVQGMLTLEGDFSKPIVIRWRTKDGRLIWTEQRVVPVKDSEGNIVAVEGTAIDVTERVRAEQELKRSEAEYRKLVMTVPCLICRVMPDGTTAFVNEYVQEITGYSPEEVIGKSWYDLFYPGDLRTQVDDLLREFQRGDVSGFEMTLIDKHDRLKTLLWNSFNLWDEDGHTLAEFNGAGIDVTARKAAENALRESGAFNRAVLDSLDANIAVLDGSGVIIAVNKSWTAYARQNEADLREVGVGANYIEVCRRAAADGDGLAGRVAEAILKVMDGTMPSFSMEYPHETPTDKRWYLLQATPLTKRRGGAVVSHIDITARKTMEEALRESEAHYRSIFETAGSAMAIVNPDSTIVLVNSEFEKLTGYSKGEVQGRMSWQSFVGEADRPRLAEYREKRLKDPESAPPQYHFRAVDRFGADKYLLAHVALIPGTSRTIVSVLDETDRMRYDEAMQQVNKKLDLLARITRHDILNQLAILSGYLDLARERVTDEGISALLVKSQTASESIRRHLEFARDYQNMGTKRPLWIDVQAASKRAAANLELKGVKMVSELGGLEVFSDPMLEKVFYNLVDNSVKHGEKTTSISFKYSLCDDGMRIIYEDNGVGIAERDKEAIFDRSAGDREGRRGYGLYLAREILGITGITLAEAGKEGEGARFEMVVPKGKYRTKKEQRRRKGKKRTS